MNLWHDWLTTLQVAEILGVTDVRVRQLCQRKQLVAVKLGRDWRIDPASVGERHTLMEKRA